MSQKLKQISISPFLNIAFIVLILTSGRIPVQALTITSTLNMGERRRKTLKFKSEKGLFHNIL